MCSEKYQCLLIMKKKHMINLVEHRKKSLYFYEHILKQPRYFLAPMVRGSENAFRRLVRNFGIDITYTPMITAWRYNNNCEVEHKVFDVEEDERPIVLQLAGNDPTELLTTAKKLESKVDAIDLNFGCPQKRAQTYTFGAFLLDYPNKMVSIVELLSQNLNIPGEYL